MSLLRRYAERQGELFVLPLAPLDGSNILEMARRTTEQSEQQMMLFIIPRHKVEGGYRNGCCPSVLPSRFVSGAEHKNRERYLNQTWYIDRSSGEMVPFDSLGFKKIFFFF